MKKFLVITTINQPTKAIYKFLDILNDDRKIVIVGDRKGPIDYIEHDKLIFLDIEKQYELYPEFAKAIPERHYARKNIGYYHAIKLGADYIAETDDDNIPYDIYPQFIDEKEYECNVINDQGSINTYKYFTDKKIRPRGLDLQCINKDLDKSKMEKKIIKPYIQHALEDKDPDVDAIYRMVLGDEVYFDKNKNIALGNNTRAPFNTQNTYWQKEAFPFLYIPHSVIRRASDIWKSYIAQRGIKEIGGSVLFQSPTVYQERNNHNLQVDFNEEIVCYKNAGELINALDSINLGDVNTSEILLVLYEKLIDLGWFNSSELTSLHSRINIFR